MSLEPVDDALDEMLEDYPDDLAESLSQREAWRRQVADQNADLEFIIADLDRWPVGTPIKAAFLDGSDELHARIARAVQPIGEACGVTIDFGADHHGGFHRWTTSDRDYAADIRISFDQGGYWSLVGTASVDSSVGSPFGGVGGRPNQRSLNLGGYTERLPGTWRRTVLHEFLHALAFKHEHQNMLGPCQDEFRWEDDEWYVPTLDDTGRFIGDEHGRRPGIYTYLSGAPNRWSKAKVDHNLRSAGAEDAAAGPFDPASVMLYRFPKLFYKTDPSGCAPQGNGQELSEGDERGLNLLYPKLASAQEAEREKRGRRADTAIAAVESLEMLESADDGNADYLASTMQLLDRLT